MSSGETLVSANPRSALISDGLYAQMQVMAHREAVAMFGTYAQAGTDPNLRTFAQQALPHLEHHLAMARGLPGAGGRARRG